MHTVFSRRIKNKNYEDEKKTIKHNFIFQNTLSSNIIFQVISSYIFL